MCYVWFELENFILEEARVSREDTICFEGNEINIVRAIDLSLQLRLEAESLSSMARADT